MENPVITGLHAHENLIRFQGICLTVMSSRF